MKHIAKGIGEHWRGGSASLRFLAGAPVAFAQASHPAKSRDSGRDLVGRHFSRFLHACRVKVTVEGDVPEPGQGCVICHNETSFADVAAYFVGIWPHVDRVAGADLYAYFPFARAAFRKLDIEMVPRGKRAATERLLARMVHAVKQGERVGWGGEGRLSGKDGIGHFKVGGSLIAIRAQAPVIPVVIHGGHAAMPLGTVRARPGEIRIRFCKPVPTGGCTEADARAFADELRSQFVRNYEDLAAKRQTVSP